MAPPPLTYVYGVVPSSFDATGIPSGIDDTPVTLVPAGPIAALVSQVDGVAYDAHHVAQDTANVHWLGERAAAHDRVLTWASDRAAVVPLPIFSLFVEPARVAAMLADRLASLEALLAYVGRGREYVIRMWRMDPLLGDYIHELSPKLAALEAEMKAATPGQRYLLGRKLEEERKLEMRRVGAEVARRAHFDASEFSYASMIDPPPRDAKAADVQGTLVLQGAYLVGPESFDGFRAIVTVLERTYSHRGLRVEFSGPWPAYHFVRAEPPVVAAAMQ